MFAGRRNNRRNNGRGVGRGLPPRQPEPANPAEYLLNAVLDEQAEGDLRAAAAAHQRREIERAAERTRVDTTEAYVEYSDIQRRREVVRLRTTRARSRRAQIYLDNEERALAHEEEVSAMEERFYRP